MDFEDGGVLRADAFFEAALEVLDFVAGLDEGAFEPENFGVDFRFAQLAVVEGRRGVGEDEYFAAGDSWRRRNDAQDDFTATVL